VDLKSSKAKVSPGHELLGFNNGELQVRSHRYPFCIGNGDSASDDNIHSGTLLVPFNQELNRLVLIVKHPKAASYKVTWGNASHVFKAADLSGGINLAQEFLENPFSDAFKKVDQAVADKQAFETDEIKKMMHGNEGKADMEGTVKRAEEKRAGLVAAVNAAFVPVTHTLKIEPQ
jgi:hypothetical protein